MKIRLEVSESERNELKKNLDIPLKFYESGNDNQYYLYLNSDEYISKFFQNQVAKRLKKEDVIRMIKRRDEIINLENPTKEQLTELKRLHRCIPKSGKYSRSEETK